MRTRSLCTCVLAVSLAMLAACGDDAGTTTSNDVELGRYVRLADPSFDSIEECEAAKEQANDGRLFNCAQLLTLTDEGTYVSVLTDIAEPGTFVVEDSRLVLTSDPTGSTFEIPVNDDGTLGDGWMLDLEAENEDS